MDFTAWHLEDGTQVNAAMDFTAWHHEDGTQVNAAMDFTAGIMRMEHR